MKRVLVGLALVGGALGCSKPEPPPTLLAGAWVDLTHDFAADTIYWPTADTFQLDVLSYDYTSAGYFYAANNFRAAEHGGTHIDAPVHFSEGGWTLGEIPLERLIGPGVLVDVSEQSAADRDLLIMPEHLKAWEAEHGRIPEGAIVLFRTGFDAFWPDRSSYMGTSRRGVDAVAELHFPGLSPAAARWLTENREIHAVGIDTPSIDFGQSPLFEAHQILFAANVPALENVASLDQVPPLGATIVALPMKIRDGSGGPLRIVAYLPPAG